MQTAIKHLLDRCEHIRIEVKETQGLVIQFIFEQIMLLHTMQRRQKRLSKESKAALRPLLSQTPLSDPNSPEPFVSFFSWFFSLTVL